jgi:hypothetical protein
MRLEKKDIDWQRETVKLRDAISKNKQPALLSFKKFPAMRAVLLRRKEKLRLDCPFIFHRNGRAIKDFRDEWKRTHGGGKTRGAYGPCSMPELRRESVARRRTGNCCVQVHEPQDSVDL